MFSEKRKMLPEGLESPGHGIEAPQEQSTEESSLLLSNTPLVPSASPLNLDLGSSLLLGGSAGWGWGGGSRTCHCMGTESSVPRLRRGYCGPSTILSY